MLLLSRLVMCSGKSLRARLWFGPKPAWNVLESAAGKPLPSTRRRPGSAWLLVRLSAPALKWHVAQAVLPSLPNCISQKKALPRAMAAFLFLIIGASSAAVGPGIVTLLREARPRSPSSSSPRPPFPPPPFPPPFPPLPPPPFPPSSPPWPPFPPPPLPPEPPFPPDPPLPPEPPLPPLPLPFLPFWLLPPWLMLAWIVAF